MYAVKKNEIVLEGTRNFSDKLWDIPVYNSNILPCSLQDTPCHAGRYAKPLLRTLVKNKRDCITNVPSRYKIYLFP